MLSSSSSPVFDLNNIILKRIDDIIALEEKFYDTRADKKSESETKILQQLLMHILTLISEEALPSYLIKTTYDPNQAQSFLSEIEKKFNHLKLSCEVKLIIGLYQLLCLKAQMSNLKNSDLFNRKLNQLILLSMHNLLYFELIKIKLAYWAHNEIIYHDQLKKFCNTLFSSTQLDSLENIFYLLPKEIFSDIFNAIQLIISKNESSNDDIKLLSTAINYLQSVQIKELAATLLTKLKNNNNISVIRNTVNLLITMFVKFDAETRTQFLDYVLALKHTALEEQGINYYSISTFISILDRVINHFNEDECQLITSPLQNVIKSYRSNGNGEIFFEKILNILNCLNPKTNTPLLLDTIMLWLHDYARFNTYCHFNTTAQMALLLTPKLSDLTTEQHNAVTLPLIDLILEFNSKNNISEEEFLPFFQSVKREIVNDHINPMIKRLTTEKSDPECERLFSTLRFFTPLLTHHELLITLNAGMQFMRDIKHSYFEYTIPHIHKLLALTHPVVFIESLKIIWSDNINELKILIPYLNEYDAKSFFPKILALLKNNNQEMKYDFIMQLDNLFEFIFKKSHFIELFFINHPALDQILAYSLQLLKNENLHCIQFGLNMLHKLIPTMPNNTSILPAVVELLKENDRDRDQNDIPICIIKKLKSQLTAQQQAEILFILFRIIPERVDTIDANELFDDLIRQQSTQSDILFSQLWNYVHPKRTYWHHSVTNSVTFMSPALLDLTSLQVQLKAGDANSIPFLNKKAVTVAINTTYTAVRFFNAQPTINPVSMEQTMTPSMPKYS
ncbi:MAG: hypothetical protein P4M12_04065 [Gammaproteobacteria bacterium]|nr:hypothetical protein [Gammaproteobacteria bacterium]